MIREHEPEDGIPLLRSGELDLLVSESYEDVAERADRRPRGAPAGLRAAAARDRGRRG